MYATAVGYISTPLFSELPIAGWVLEHYSTVYILLMMITTTVLVVMMLTKMRTLPKAILVFITMSVVLVLPVELLNVGISWSNVIADKIYSDKFTYWAVVQQAEYYNNLAKSADARASDCRAPCRWLYPQGTGSTSAGFSASNV